MVTDLTQIDGACRVKSRTKNVDWDVTVFSSHCHTGLGTHVRHGRSITRKERCSVHLFTQTATNGRMSPPHTVASPQWKATCMSHHRSTRWSKTLATATVTPATNEVLTSDEDTTAAAAAAEDIDVARVHSQAGETHVFEVMPMHGGTVPWRRHRCTRSRDHRWNIRTGQCSAVSTCATFTNRTPRYSICSGELSISNTTVDVHGSR